MTDDTAIDPTDQPEEDAQPGDDDIPEIVPHTGDGTDPIPPEAQ